MTAATIDAPAAFLAARRPLVIDKPGVYDITHDDYIKDPVPGGSLSSTGARKLLAPSCPALYRHEQLHGRPPKRVFDFGSAAHKLVLGTGPELVVVDAEDWKTKDAQALRDDAYLDGAIPLLKREYDQVVAMADAIRKDPIASILFDPDGGRPEQSLFWQDQQTGVQCRARLDWLPNPGGGRILVPDFKSTPAADLDSCQKSISKFGYHQQASFYLDGMRALGLADKDAQFLFVFQERNAPYLVTVVELDVMFLRIGAYRNRQAIELYAECKATDTWPGHATDIERISPPAWVENQFLEETS